MKMSDKTLRKIWVSLEAARQASRDTEMKALLTTARNAVQSARRKLDELEFAQREGNLYGL